MRAGGYRSGGLGFSLSRWSDTVAAESVCPPTSLKMLKKVISRFTAFHLLWATAPLPSSTVSKPEGLKAHYILTRFRFIEMVRSFHGEAS
jgi:hypothetical protein